MRGKLDRFDALPIEAALCMARLSDLRSRHGAVIADAHGLILGRGKNFYEGGIHTVHAEVVAIGDAVHNYPGGVFQRPKALTLYSCRSLRNGQQGCAMPCKGCEALIRKTGIKRIVYTEDTGRPRLMWY